ncbi:ATP-binding cassette domain-containing protein [Ruminococcaceae bacterium OttesenSCG-928-O06]|nr:ATP-binding cassette domain-containing protein [Ruminococcaceae bacterium OttesenSCG-928-O06]
MMLLEVKGLYKSYAGGNGPVPALRGVNLRLPKGLLLTILGRSGCGKTTLLRCVAGHEAPDAGEICFEGVPIAGPGHKRFMVYQQYDQLFPWMRVGQNIAFALRAVHPALAPAEANDTAAFWLAECGLPDSGGLWPAELSGGMKQRAALARAFALQPALLLLDEPFAGLDAVLRHAMQVLLLGLCQKHGLSALFVTHDIAEALDLSPAPCLMRPDGTEILPLDKTTPREEILALL